MSNTDASLYKPHLPVLVAQNQITLKYYKFQGHYLGPKSDIYLKGRFAHPFFAMKILMISWRCRAGTLLFLYFSNTTTEHVVCSSPPNLSFLLSLIFCTDTEKRDRTSEISSVDAATSILLMSAESAETDRIR